MKTERKILARNSKGGIISYVWLVDGKEVPEGLKYCPGCDDILPQSSFSKAGNKCKECANAASRAHYHKRRTDPEWVEAKKTKAKEEGYYRKLRAINHMGGKCHDCDGIFPPSVYDFHHLDPSAKEHNLGDIVRRKSFETVEKELSKCVLLCANCHRIRHWNFEGGENGVNA